MTQSSVRYLGSRELHRELPRILDELNDPGARLVLTIHSKPKAVMIGADAFADLVRQVGEIDRQLGQNLASLIATPDGKVVAEKPAARPKVKPDAKSAKSKPKANVKRLSRGRSAR
jgi:PHD/YefM family antitoxin component YafN of YafNO toxin-antitoxin module